MKDTYYTIENNESISFKSFDDAAKLAPYFGADTVLRKRKNEVVTIIRLLIV